jgi:hypothetical protein
MSRSILASASSRLSLETSASSSVMGFLFSAQPTELAVPCPKDSVRQRLGEYGKLPRRLQDRPRLLDHLLHCLFTILLRILLPR